MIKRTELSYITYFLIRRNLGAMVGESSVGLWLIKWIVVVLGPFFNGLVIVFNNMSTDGYYTINYNHIDLFLLYLYQYFMPQLLSL